MSDRPTNPEQRPSSSGISSSPSSDWHWHEREGSVWLTCDRLANWPHAFSTRSSYPDRPDRLAPVQLGLSGETAFAAQQVHGNAIAWTDVVEFPARSNSSAPLPEADAVATSISGQSAWVMSADCVPISIAHPRAVVAIHSGWRGTAARIAPAAVASLRDRGIAPADLTVAIGPAISGQVYQVSREVGDRVRATLSDVSLDPEFPILLPDPDPDKVRLDLRNAIARQLVEMGVAIANISISPHCTYSQPEFFFSYRRDRKSPSPIQWSGIGLR
ncbi:MAG: peptidoglycan editing factor PgeF [Cyanobacteria bacterium J06639_1]